MPMNFTLDLIAGLAHALLVGVLLVSGTGKLVGCRNGSRAMCIKASADLTLAALSCVWWNPWIALPACVAIGALGAGGWLRERQRKSTVCNCFGVLSAPLSPLRNVTRLVMVAGSASLAISMLARPVPAALPASTLAAGLLGAALVLVGVVYALAGGLNKRAKLEVEEPAPQSVRFDASDVVGHDADGRVLTIGDLVEPGKMLALVVGADGCSHCKELEEEYAAHAERFPFPLYLLSNAPHAAPANPHLLVDETRWVHLHAGISGTPSLLVIDPNTLVAGAPIRGGLHSRRMLLELLLSEGAPPDRQAVPTLRLAAAG